jgi:hypothetical protein
MIKLSDHPPTTLHLTFDPIDDDLPELSGLSQGYQLDNIQQEQREEPQNTLLFRNGIEFFHSETECHSSE